MGRSVFISRASADRKIAELACEKLEGAGFSCWIAPRDVGAGEYAGVIYRAINEAKVLVILVSGAASRSRNVRNEVHHAFDGGKCIIPFRIDNVALDDSLKFNLGATHWINELHLSQNSRLEKLIESVRTEIQSSEQPIETSRGLIVAVNSDASEESSVSDQDPAAPIVDDYEEYDNEEYEYSEDSDQYVADVVVGEYKDVTTSTAKERWLFSLPPRAILEGDSSSPVPLPFIEIYSELRKFSVRMSPGRASI